MRFFEFKPLKPLTPQQARIAALKRNADNARMALKQERDNQKKQRANQQLQKLSVQKIYA
jgi:hypothetical protein